MSQQSNRPRCPIPAMFKGLTRPATPLSDRLKTLTRAQHDEAEGHPLHAVLFGSQGADAAREAYRRLLGQHLVIQQAFEPLLADAAANWGSLLRPEHLHLNALLADCTDLGVGPDFARPLPATVRFVEFIRRSAEGAASPLLGVFYVFEGSTNGGTIIAMRVKDLLGLEGDRGTRFINPHGTKVRAVWSQWKADADAIPLREPEAAAAVAGAQESFRLSHALLGDVHAAMGAPSGPPQVVVLPLKPAAQV